MYLRKCVLFILLTLSPALWADGWTMESQIIPFGDKSPRDHMMSGSTLFVSVSSDGPDYEIIREVQIYEKTLNGWELDQTIGRPENVSEAFSQTISVSGDTALIAHGYNGTYNAGGEQVLADALGVYRKGANGWSFDRTIPLGAGTLLNTFDLDGNTAAVSMNVDGGDVDSSGLPVTAEVVQIWEWIDGDWVQSATIENPDADSRGVDDDPLYFGYDVDLAGDTIAISGTPYQLNATDESKGAVYLFERQIPADNSEPTWEFLRRLTQDTTLGQASFGFQVDLTENRLLITNIYRNGDEYGSEAVYLYTKDATGQWVDDGVIRSYDQSITDYIIDLTGIRYPSFEIDAGLLVGDMPVVWSRHFGVKLEKDSTGWQPAGLLRHSEEINAKKYNNGNEAREGAGSIVFIGLAGEFSAETGIPPALIISETECTASRPLEPLKWTTISPPCLSPDSPLTVADIFADDFEGAVLGSDWVVFRFDLESYNYEAMQLDDVLEPGAGYWIISALDETVILDMPTEAIPSRVNVTSADVACVDQAKGCLETELPRFETTRAGFRMVGNPHNALVEIADLRIQSDEGACSGTCDLDEANDAELVFNILYRYRGQAPYDFLTTDDQLLPWDAVFLATYEDATGLDTNIVYPQMAIE